MLQALIDSSVRGYPRRWQEKKNNLKNDNYTRKRKKDEHDESEQSDRERRYSAECRHRQASKMEIPTLKSLSTSVTSYAFALFIMLHTHMLRRRYFVRFFSLFFFFFKSLFITIQTSNLGAIAVRPALQLSPCGKQSFILSVVIFRNSAGGEYFFDCRLRNVGHFNFNTRLILPKVENTYSVETLEFKVYLKCI